MNPTNAAHRLDGGNRFKYKMCSDGLKQHFPNFLFSLLFFQKLKQNYSLFIFINYTWTKESAVTFYFNVLKKLLWKKFLNKFHGVSQCFRNNIFAKLKTVVRFIAFKVLIDVNEKNIYFFKFLHYWWKVKWIRKIFLGGNLKTWTNWFNLEHQDSLPKTGTVPAKRDSWNFCLTYYFMVDHYWKLLTF